MKSTIIFKGALQIIVPVQGHSFSIPQEMQTTDADLNKTCKSCGYSGDENYCSHCGQPYTTKRITLSGLLHDIIHLFTHLDRGFGYTLKKLITQPGRMQREYAEGYRSKHQKPFSMFFICATITALSRYWIFQALIKYYHVGSISEMNFINEYMVIFHIALLPLHALITYLFFFRSGYNYAEIGMLILYSISAFFLITTGIALLKFAWPKLDTAYIEFPLLIIYTTITYLNFFDTQRAWVVMLKTIAITTVVFLLIQVIEDFAIELTL